jgi:flagellin-like protein
MFNLRKLHKNESGLSALETAIILIAFIVVASVFAFTILSAGSSSTEKSKQAINAGLEQVQSSMTIKGDVIAMGNVGGTAVDNAVFTLSLVSAGDPVDLTSTAADRKVVMSSRWRPVGQQPDFTVARKQRRDNLLEDNELAEITIDLTGRRRRYPQHGLHRRDQPRPARSRLSARHRPHERRDGFN